MRLTKKLLREATRGLLRRQNELCAILAAGKIRDELQRCFPIYLEQATPEREAECFRQLLQDALERSIPSHWTE